MARALRLIGEGALDADGDVESLATRLGIGARHLRRLFDEHLGTSPVRVAQTRRVHLARKFIDETIAQASETGYVRTLMGRRRNVPEIRSGKCPLDVTCNL